MNKNKYNLDFKTRTIFLPSKMMVELEEAKQLNGSLKLVEEEYEDTHQRSKMVH
jgi:hypothetical protein